MNHVLLYQAISGGVGMFSSPHDYYQAAQGVGNMRAANESAIRARMGNYRPSAEQLERARNAVSARMVKAEAKTIRNRKRLDLIDRVSSKLAFEQITDWRRWMRYGGIRREICDKALEKLLVIR